MLLAFLIPLRIMLGESSGLEDSTLNLESRVTILIFGLGTTLSFQPLWIQIGTLNKGYHSQRSSLWGSGGGVGTIAHPGN